MFKKMSIMITKNVFSVKKNKSKSESLKNTKTKIFIFSNKIFGQKIPKNMTFLVWIRLFSMFFSISKVSEPRQICFFTVRRIWQGKKSPCFRQNRPKLAIFQWNKVAKEWKWQISSNRPETFSSVIFMSKGTLWKHRQLILWTSLHYERAYSSPSTFWQE